MQIRRDDLDDAAQEGILSADQAEALWQHLRERHSDDADSARVTGIDAAQIAYYAGALIVMGAMGWFATEALEQSGAWLLPIGLVYAGIFGGAGYWLRYRKNLPLPGGLLFTVAVGMTPLAVYGLQHAVGLMPPDEPSEYWTFYDAIGGLWVPAKATTLLVSALVLRFVRFPPLVALVAVASWVLALDLVPLLLGPDTENWTELEQSISVGVGLITLVISFFVDRRSTDRGFAFWGYLVGLLAFWGGLTAMDASTEWSRLGYFLINVGLIGASIVLQRRVFLVFGALGAYGYLGYLSYDLFADSLWFTFALTALGASLIAGGVFYQRHRDRIEQRVRTWMGLQA